MGSSVSTGFITPTPKKLSWRCRKEDTVKLEDALTQREEALWRVKAKQSLFVKKVHLTRSIGYVDLGHQESNSFYPNGGEMLNPAFVGDQAWWMTEFTADNYFFNSSKRHYQVAIFEGKTANSPCNASATQKGCTTRLRVWNYGQEARHRCTFKMILLGGVWNEVDLFVCRGVILTDQLHVI